MANKIVPQTLNSSGVYDKLITAISSGGTGAESESAAVKNLISGLTSTSPASDDLIPFQDVSSGGAGKTTLSALASALQSVRSYARFQTGSYVGTGTYGDSSPCSLTFDLTPKFFCIAGVSDGVKISHGIAVYGSNGLQHTKPQASTYYANLTWQENGITWYANDAFEQFNENTMGKTIYYYIVIGE